MTSHFSRLLARLACLLGWIAVTDLCPAQTPDPGAQSGGTLQMKLDRAVAETLDRFAEQRLASNQLAVTVVDLRDPTHQLRASYRGAVQIYPASVVKLFYLGALHHWLESGQLQESDELRRAARDMIVDSSNDATHYIIDLLTGTTSGPELSSEELETWYHRRNAVNRYFASLGYREINANRKPWCDGPYGRESQSVKAHRPNHRNWLTTDATARLVTEIALGKSVTPERSNAMMRLLLRDPFATGQPVDAQARHYTGKALSPGDKLWSKAGWTSEVRHDAAYVELKEGAKFVLVTFTTGHAQNAEVIPFLARKLIEQIRPQNQKN